MSRKRTLVLSSVESLHALLATCRDDIRAEKEAQRIARQEKRAKTRAEKAAAETGQTLTDDSDDDAEGAASENEDTTHSLEVRGHFLYVTKPYSMLQTMAAVQPLPEIPPADFYAQSRRPLQDANAAPQPATRGSRKRAASVSEKENAPPAKQLRRSTRLVCLNWVSVAF